LLVPWGMFQSSEGFCPVGPIFAMWVFVVQSFAKVRDALSRPPRCSPSVPTLPVLLMGGVRLHDSRRGSTSRCIRHNLTSTTCPPPLSQHKAQHAPRRYRIWRREKRGLDILSYHAPPTMPLPQNIDEICARVQGELSGTDFDCNELTPLGGGNANYVF